MIYWRENAGCIASIGVLSGSDCENELMNIKPDFIIKSVMDLNII